MKRILIGSMVLVLLACPLVALGAIGAMFLATPNDRPEEFAPIPIGEVGQTPRLVPLYVVRRDAWMQVPGEFGGEAYVRRTATGEVVVLSANHPRMGEYLEYLPDAECYQSVCFLSRFDLDGRWFHDSVLSMYPVGDMRRLDFRTDGKSLVVRAPIPRVKVPYSAE